MNATVEPRQDGSVPSGGGRLQADRTRLGLAGFFLAGLLMSLLGPVLVAWRYHLRSDFSTAGKHFLGVAIGIVIAVSLAHRLIPRKGISFVLHAASVLASAALLYLALVSPPQYSSWLRLAGMVLIGGSAGLLLSGLFEAISPAYRHDPAATANIAGVLFVLGSLGVALVAAGAFNLYTVSSMLVLFALVPAVFGYSFSKTRFPAVSGYQQPAWRQVWQDLRSPSAVLFALVLFFQFGNEWSIAGWLAVFQIQRIGVSPAASLLLLALYWTALLVGRIVIQSLLPKVSHVRLLMTGVLAALFGCVILSFTKSVFGTVSGILFVGAGFATVYPLVVEKIGGRFPDFNPGLFNGIFSFAMVGGLLAPWTLGYFADWWGIGVLMILPLLGTAMVFLLLVLIWLEAKLSGHPSAS